MWPFSSSKENNPKFFTHCLLVSFCVVALIFFFFGSPSKLFKALKRIELHYHPWSFSCVLVQLPHMEHDHRCKIF